jgi:predicted glycosyltransferase
MKILHYCQYVLGIGHFFRTLEIDRALAEHEIILVTGGSEIDVRLPNHIQEFRLPGLHMDREFKNLFAKNRENPVAQIKKERRQMLFSLYKKASPDVFIVELYPFGRRGFSFEIDPILKGIRYQILKPGRVICSLRDILVDRRKYKASYEAKVVDLLNNYFDALLIHSDPSLLKIDATFSSIEQITIPVVYTGFVTPKPSPNARRRLRKKMGVKKNDKLIVASLGGGKVGRSLLEAVLDAFQLIDASNNCFLAVFTGPFMEQQDVDRLQKQSSKKISVERFTPEFLSYLAAADLSISMAGYNTCMNILAAKVPALVWPFSQNREQRFRAERLSENSAMRVLNKHDLKPSRLANIIDQTLIQPLIPVSDIDLDGANKTAQWIQNWTNQLSFS